MVKDMSKHRYIDKICIVATILSLVLAVIFLCKGFLGFEHFVKEAGYESKLFDTSQVHTIDIVMDDWDTFIENCQNEEYAICEISIDGETYKNVGIRGKGNTSLSNVSSMGSERYSFKVEFDQYDDTENYYGLDKLSLNNIIQDNTFMKDYLTYRMMNEFGVDAPLCSFAYITVNGEDWGLYLAVEGVEDSFLQRNYGNDYGELYKPDSMNFGGGRGNGKEFDFDKLQETFSQSEEESTEVSADIQKSEERKNNKDMGGGMSMGTSDVKLQYIDDEPSSYSNIFGGAKTDISSADETRLIRSLEILSSGENIESVVDVDEVMRYFVVHNFVCNGDSYTGSMIHNYYLYEEDGKLSMIPWDYNLAFGTFQGGDATEEVNSPIDTPVSGGSTDDRPMIDWIFNSEKYTKLYHQYFEEFLKTVDAVAIIENAETLISEYVKKDPTKFCTYEEFLKGVETLKEFCSLRKESVEGQLSGEIPSTTTGQKEDETMLVDASHINISDMGTMGNAMGQGGREQGEREKTQVPENVTSDEMTEEGVVDEMPEMPDMSGEFSEMPEMPEDFRQGMGGFGGEAPSGDFSQMQRPGATDTDTNTETSFGKVQEEISMQQFPGSMTNDAGMNDRMGNLILFGVSVVILIVGLMIAFKFKGKN